MRSRAACRSGLYAEPLEYRNPARLDDSYNIDRMYMGGVHIRMRAHAGQNHQKTVRLVGQHTTVFGTSNWSTASDDNQLEVNYFTTKDWFYQFFANQFEWKWNNRRSTVRVGPDDRVRAAGRPISRPIVRAREHWPRA